jgi:hypothetical protein
MDVPTIEVGYTSATTGRGDHEVHKGHVVALGKIYIYYFFWCSLNLKLYDARGALGAETKYQPDSNILKCIKNMIIIC